MNLSNTYLIIRFIEKGRLPSAELALSEPATSICELENELILYDGLRQTDLRQPDLLERVGKFP